jgi:hypothetical protein
MVIHTARADTTISMPGLGRRGRQRHVFDRYHEHMQDGVLDVGCDVGELRQLVSGPYTGVDLYGEPDIVFDLSSGLPLPFGDRSFAFVVCTDVLEHLGSPYFYSDELFRVSSRDVMIGLPNCWYALQRSLATGQPLYKNYGLPPEPPGDRHHWVFTAEESWDFVLYRAAKAGFRCMESVHFLVDAEATPKGSRWSLGRALLKATRRLGRCFVRAAPPAIDDWVWLNRNTLATWWLLRRSDAECFLKRKKKPMADVA